jgi:hypothetical protein
LLCPAYKLAVYAGRDKVTAGQVVAFMAVDLERRFLSSSVASVLKVAAAILKGVAP